MNEQDHVAGGLPEEPECAINKKLLNEFEKHSAVLRERARARRNAVQLKSVVNDKEEREQTSEFESLGRRQPQDEYQGDVNMRTLRALLKMIDEKGFERYALLTTLQRRFHADVLSLARRSPHQMKFHSAFERSTARVLYKDVSEAIIQSPSVFYTDTFCMLAGLGHTATDHHEEERLGQVLF